MAITDPYRADAEMYLRDRVQHMHRVTAYLPGDSPLEDGVRLDLIGAGLTIDEDTSPRFYLQGEVGLTDEALALLDPTKGVRVLVKLGYRYTDGRTELFPVANLILRSATTRAPASTIVFQAGSDEFLIMDYVSEKTSYGVDVQISEVLRSLLSRGNSQGILISAGRASSAIGGTEPFKVETEEVWRSVQSLADRIGAEVYHDGLNGFFVVDQPKQTSITAGVFATGPSGTVKEYSITSDRDLFANYVVVTHTWENAAGVAQTVSGVAEITNGPKGTLAIGRVGKSYTVDDVSATATIAQAEANSILARDFSRGRRIHVEDAMARYWLRPGMTVETRLTPNTSEKSLITRVDFDLPSGTMAFDTRLPEPATL